MNAQLGKVKGTVQKSRCPYCGNVYLHLKSMVGRTVQCPKCLKRIVLV